MLAIATSKLKLNSAKLPKKQKTTTKKYQLCFLHLSHSYPLAQVIKRKCFISTKFGNGWEFHTHAFLLGTSHLQYYKPHNKLVEVKLNCIKNCCNFKEARKDIFQNIQKESMLGELITQKMIHQIVLIIWYYLGTWYILFDNSEPKKISKSFKLRCYKLYLWRYVFKPNLVHLSLSCRWNEWSPEQPFLHPDQSFSRYKIRAEWYSVS